MTSPLRYAIRIQTSNGWVVVDTAKQLDTIATCPSLEHATLVSNALNFNDHPSQYGYKLVNGDDDD